ncbi:MAG: tRNA pseudouridine(38-40) synthase TruA [Methanomicrobiales archaeon HGW-Methanomicrobiales-4]|nr:MAG: tRNA pseudouridine(38-40) synthase TruA [Methanomicrobiales archaeon HGW-Methanomicrobiales-4]
MAQAQRQDHEVRLAFRIGYLGSGFYGSQYQPDKRTVEGEIRDACIRAGLFEHPGSAHLVFSGRTDRGVHARCQVVAFSTRYPDRARRAFPGQLPPDIWVNSVCEVSDSYSPRYDLISRTYRYIFPYQPPDIAAMRDVTPLFTGTHDFSCFARIEPGKIPMREVISLSVFERDDCCWFEVTAPSFLWHMVRCIATVLFDASDHQITPEDIRILLSGRCKNKVKPASPEGLILWNVDDQLVWEPLPAQNRTIRLHTESAAHHQVMARVHTLLKP